MKNTMIKLSLVALLAVACKENVPTEQKLQPKAQISTPYVDFSIAYPERTDISTPYNFPSPSLYVEEKRAMYQEDVNVQSAKCMSSGPGYETDWHPCTPAELEPFQRAQRMYETEQKSVH